MKIVAHIELWLLVAVLISCYPLCTLAEQGNRTYLSSVEYYEISLDIVKRVSEPCSEGRETHTHDCGCEDNYGCFCHSTFLTQNSQIGILLNSGEKPLFGGDYYLPEGSQNQVYRPPRKA